MQLQKNRQRDTSTEIQIKDRKSKRERAREREEEKEEEERERQMKETFTIEKIEATYNSRSPMNVTKCIFVIHAGNEKKGEAQTILAFTSSKRNDLLFCLPRD